MTVTYIDAGVLIAIVRQNPQNSEQAVALLNGVDRTSVSSVFLRLEVLPKAIHYGNRIKVALYEAFFARVARLGEPTKRIVELAGNVAVDHGLNALDALHVAAAMTLGAEELFTSEKRNKQIYRASGVREVPLMKLM